MTVITADVRRLCVAIDDGDDSVLGVLADALEESGDPQAAGLRKAIKLNHCPTRFAFHSNQDGGLKWRWGWINASACRRPPLIGSNRLVGLADRAILFTLFYARLPGKAGPRSWAPDERLYPISAKVYQSRSMAYLALAKALTEPQR